MKQKEQDSERSGIQVITRAAAILRAMKNNPSGMSLSQIAKKVDLPLSTVQRIIRSLQTERFVFAEAGGGGLRLGTELGALAEAARCNIVEQCSVPLNELAQSTGETSDLSVLRGDKMIILDQVPGTHRLRIVSPVGEVFPLTTTANGKACLAKLPREQALQLAEQEWTRDGASSDPATFAQSLDQIADVGLAYDTDEHTNGICAIGLAFTDWEGDVHAISIPVPSTRFLSQKSRIEEAIRKTRIQVMKMMSRNES